MCWTRGTRHKLEPREFLLNRRMECCAVSVAEPWHSRPERGWERLLYRDPNPRGHLPRELLWGGGKGRVDWGSSRGPPFNPHGSEILGVLLRHHEGLHASPRPFPRAADGSTRAVGPRVAIVLLGVRQCLYPSGSMDAIRASLVLTEAKGLPPATFLLVLRSQNSGRDLYSSSSPTPLQSTLPAAGNRDVSQRAWRKAEELQLIPSPRFAASI